MKKEKLHVNFVDLILAVLFFFIICALMAVFFSREKISDFTAKEYYEITVTFENVPKKYTTLVKQGDVVHVDNNEKSFGTVKSIRSSNASVEIQNPKTRSIEIYKSDEYYNMSVIITASGTTENNLTVISGNELENGIAVDFSVPGFSSIGKITNIKRLREKQ